MESESTTPRPWPRPKPEPPENLWEILEEAKREANERLRTVARVKPSAHQRFVPGAGELGAARSSALVRRGVHERITPGE